MHKGFEEDIKKQYPELFEDKPTKQTVVVKVRQPAYVFPMMLTIILLASYCAVNYVQNKHNLFKNQAITAKLEQDINKTKHDLDRTIDQVTLVAILQNENFASTRLYTGNRNLIFINKNWTIDSLPSYLNLTEADKKRIVEKYMPKKECSRIKQDSCLRCHCNGKCKP